MKQKINKLRRKKNTLKLNIYMYIYMELFINAKRLKHNYLLKLIKNNQGFDKSLTINFKKFFFRSPNCLNSNDLENQ